MVAALVPLDPDNLLLEREGTFNAAQAYKDSKAANLMMTYELARRLEGTGVAINAMCPGRLCKVSTRILYLGNWFTFPRQGPITLFKFVGYFGQIVFKCRSYIINTSTGSFEGRWPLFYSMAYPTCSFLAGCIIQNACP